MVAVICDCQLSTLYLSTKIFCSLQLAELCCYSSLCYCYVLNLLTPLPSVNRKGRGFRGGYFVAAMLCSTMQYRAKELTGLFSVTINRWLERSVQTRISSEGTLLTGTFHVMLSTTSTVIVASVSLSLSLPVSAPASARSSLSLLSIELPNV